MPSSVSTDTPAKFTSSLDHVVTQWMSPEYEDGASARISSQVQVVGCSTRPSTVKVQPAVSSRGVTSALSTGQSAPVSYWPGGSRSPAGRRPRPKNPRVGLPIAAEYRSQDAPSGSVRGDVATDGRLGAGDLPGSGERGERERARRVVRRRVAAEVHRGVLAGGRDDDHPRPGARGSLGDV